MCPTLRAFADGATSVREVVPVLKRLFDLSDAQCEQTLPSGRVTVLASRTHWARTYLGKAGMLHSPRRNVHEITRRGRDFLARFPDGFRQSDLEESAEFRDWKATSAQGNTATPDRPILEPSDNAQETPEAILERTFGEIEASLVEEVLLAVLGLSPDRFELLIVDLLVAMGYGGGDAAMARAIGRSGDGGIDGIINEDALGLDAVYVQAKRYALDNKVGRPAIQAFVGSLTGESATKGVFVTTSGFSSEARAYIKKVQQRIVLINGDQLARLMIRHEVGVRARQTYVLRSIDEDYFAESTA
nr:restriction endonuclease [Oceaniglobus trochenteri]